MIPMKLILITVKQLCLDRLLGSLIAIILILNIGLIASENQGRESVVAADRLINEVGSQIDAVSVNALTEKLENMLNQAAGSYLAKYGESTKDIDLLCSSGCMGDDQQVAEALVLQQMVTYGNSVLKDDVQFLKNTNLNTINMSGSYMAKIRNRDALVHENEEINVFSSFRFSGGRHVLYKKILPILLLELLVISFYLTLKGLEKERINNTAPIVYSTVTGKRIELYRLVAVFIVITIIFLLLLVAVFVQFSFRYPGCITSSNQVAANVYPSFIPQYSLSELQYFVSYSLMLYMLLIVFTGLVAASGMLFSNSFLGGACFISVIGVMLLALSKATASDIDWSTILAWNPVGLVFEYSGNKLSLCMYEWLLFSSSPTFLSSYELTVLVSWMFVDLLLLGGSWRIFKQKELRR